jgi:thymidylate kinase
MSDSDEKTIYFITGASGVGKTTLVAQLKKKYKSAPWLFLHFDQIGIPSVSEMERDFGSPSGWQEAKAHEWIDKLIHTYGNGKIFLEGQVNMRFIHNGFAKPNFKNYTIILLDCGEEEMGKRLYSLRMQPELFDKDMRNWLKFLRNQAEELKTTRIDSSNLSEDEVLKKFEEAINL